MSVFLCVLHCVVYSVVECALVARLWFICCLPFILYFITTEDGGTATDATTTEDTAAQPTNET